MKDVCLACGLDVRVTHTGTFRRHGFAYTHRNGKNVIVKQPCRLSGKKNEPAQYRHLNADTSGQYTSRDTA